MRDSQGEKLSRKPMTRRVILGSTLAAALLAGPLTPMSAAASRDEEATSEVTIESFDASGKSTGIARLKKVTRTDAEWRSQLPVDAYRVTRRAGTEPPHSGKYADNHADGLYRCICCDTALFDSKTKFESGTGWPSFWKPISPKNVTKTVDRSFGMLREAISCTLCDAHLGHVFDDGPRPTGLRYCMNSVALKFVERT